MLKNLKFVALMVVSIGAGLTQSSAYAASSPVLIELFTSEGCSSCPPADRLLQKFDKFQPIAGTQLIVLSEHVDYWNHDGWTDPFSSAQFTDRQSEYSRKFSLQGPYTPQMIVDGMVQLVGNDAAHAQQALDAAGHELKLAIRLSSISLLDPKRLKAHIEVDALPDTFKVHKVDVYLVVALNQAESKVLHGENSGRSLSHVAVVRALVKVGTAERGKPFSTDAEVKLPMSVAPADIRVIAFVQQTGLGKVVGATMQQPTK